MSWALELRLKFQAFDLPIRVLSVVGLVFLARQYHYRVVHPIDDGSAKYNSNNNNNELFITYRKNFAWNMKTKGIAKSQAATFQPTAAGAIEMENGMFKCMVHRIRKKKSGRKTHLGWASVWQSMVTSVPAGAPTS